VIYVERESVEKLKCWIDSDDDPTLFTVEFSFPLTGVRPTVWTGGTWAAAAVPSSHGFRRRALTPSIGSGGLDLAEATYGVWVRVAGTWVKFVDSLKIH